MTTLAPTVFVVDDDQAVRRFVCGLIRSVDLEVEAYASAREFLDGYAPGRPGCLLLDIRMPDMSGLELQQALAAREFELPIIILSGHGSVQVAVHAMKAGAVDFIEKPFNNDLLLDRIQKAVGASERAHAARAEGQEIARRLGLLTPREREVLDQVVSGQTNKAIARRLDISTKTVEVHRAHMMEKMQVDSLAGLVKMVSTVERG